MPHPNDSKDDDFIFYHPTTCYDLLGVGKDATEQQIQAAYDAHQQAIQRANYAEDRLKAFLSEHEGQSLSWDEDKLLVALQQNAIDAARSQARERHPRVAAAYAILSVPEERQAYDAKIQREKEQYIANIIHNNLRGLLSTDSAKAFFDKAEDASIPVPPAFFYARVSPQAIGLVLDRSFPNEDPLHATLYMQHCDAFFDTLATRVNRLFINEFYSQNPEKRPLRSEGLFTTEEEAAKFPYRIIVKVNYKDPLQLKNDPVQAADIVSMRASNLACKVFENGLYRTTDLEMKK